MAKRSVQLTPVKKTHSFGRKTKDGTSKGVFGSRKWAEFSGVGKGPLVQRFRHETFQEQAYREGGSRTGKGVQVKKAELQPGEEFDPQKHFPQAPMPVDKVAASPGAIFTLTGGFYPTFTDDFANMDRYYKQYAAGMILVQESLTMQGPGATFLRGNHVWYNYAKDYIPELKKIVAEIPSELNLKKKTLVDDEHSDYLDIMMSYLNGIEHYSRNLLTSWREAMGTHMAKTATLVSDKDYEDTADARNAQQAPEEAIPNLLEQLLGPDVFNALTGDDAEMVTYGGAHSIDIMFRFGEKLYVIDVTQSDIAKGSTHTSIGTFKQLTAQEKQDFEGTLDEAREDKIRKHFEYSRDSINMLIQDIHGVLKQAGYTGLQNEGEMRKALQKMQKEEKGFVRADTGKAGEGLRGSDIEKTIRKFNGEYNNLLASGAKRLAIKETFEAVMHILGGTFQATDDFHDIMVVNLDPNNEKWLVGPNWSLQTVGDFPQLVLKDVMFNIDHNFYMDWFMKTHLFGLKDDEGKAVFDDAMRIQIIEAANALWNRDSMYVVGEGITTGQITTSAEALPTMAGYQVAGGAVVFEPSTLNEDLAEALQEVIDESVNNPSSFGGKTQEVLQKGMIEASRFSAQWNRGSIGSQTMLGMAQNDIGSEYETLMEGMHDAMQADDPDKYIPMNKLLRSKTWVAPYIGVHYQGGRSQKVETMLGAY